MGKRKSSSKPQAPKRADPLPTIFTCLFCNHEKAVSVKLNKKAGVGQLDCRICSQSFQCPINYLSAAVDVYGEWVDAADAVAAEAKEEEEAGAAVANRRLASTRTAQDNDQADDDDDDDDIEIDYRQERSIVDDDD